MRALRPALAAAALFLAGVGAAHAQDAEGRFIAALENRIANAVSIDQHGGPHRGAAAQRGWANRAAIAQNGRHSTATIAQTGNANTATIRQIGNRNSGSIVQTGDNNAACLLQIGRNVSGEIVQTGGESVGVIQTPHGAREVPVELCNAARLGRGGVLMGVRRR